MRSCYDIRRALESQDGFLHLLHPAPDGDSIGCCVGMHLALKKKGKQSYVYSPNRLPSVFLSLPGAEEIHSAKPDFSRYPVLMLYDLGDVARIERDYGWLLRQSSLCINIDHHVSNTRFADLNLVDVKAAATGELVFRLLKAMDGLDKDIASWLYVSLMTDTGNFRFSNTTAQTLRIASDLVLLGANPNELYRAVYEQKDFNRLCFIRECLQRVRLEERGRVAAADIPFALFRRYRQENEDSQEVLDYMRGLRGVKVAVLFKEFKDKVKISLRSSSEVDVERIAQQFGGGGHPKASGADFSLPLAEVKKQVMKVLHKELKSYG